MTAPSVITPRSANKLKKAKQLNGTASASNKYGYFGLVRLTALGHDVPWVKA